MTWNNGPLTRTAGTGGVNGQRLVKLASGTVIYCTASATDDPIGATLYDAIAGDPVGVKTLNNPGSLELEAAEVIALGADIFAGASGKATALPTAAGTYRRVGKALSAATADGDVIEALPYNDGKTITVT